MKGGRRMYPSVSVLPGETDGTGEAVLLIT